MTGGNVMGNNAIPGIIHDCADPSVAPAMVKMGECLPPSVELSAVFAVYHCAAHEGELHVASVILGKDGGPDLDAVEALVSRMRSIAYQLEQHYTREG